ncbi:hypothetical protein E2C01_025624 [Portunus trituberculatus]|uniref:Uncharacterized protein n=1 Tax=Portunus trituberculatus TaxID=210409 RepID=A0A5B7EIF2_PORTR|nr:hypothetical protein [Portunus trituberculatus]
MLVLVQLSVVAQSRRHEWDEGQQYGIHCLPSTFTAVEDQCSAVSFCVRNFCLFKLGKLHNSAPYTRRAPYPGVALSINTNVLTRPRCDVCVIYLVFTLRRPSLL